MELSKKGLLNTYRVEKKGHNLYAIYALSDNAYVYQGTVFASSVKKAIEQHEDNFVYSLEY